MHVVVYGPLLAFCVDGFVPIWRTPVDIPHSLALFRMERASIVDFSQTGYLAVLHFNNGDELEINPVRGAIDFAASTYNFGFIGTFKWPVDPLSIATLMSVEIFLDD